MGRSFGRKPAERRYRTIFVIAAEGTKTERSYFDVFVNLNPAVQIKCVTCHGGRAPHQILEKLKRHLKENALKFRDEAWLVVDTDSWTPGQFDQVFSWASEKPAHGLAISNPKFEYWLLLHFEDGDGPITKNSCGERLKKHLPDYDKTIDARQIDTDMIRTAIARAKNRDLVENKNRLGR
jgi:hypothetical protein